MGEHNPYQFDDNVDSDLFESTGTSRVRHEGGHKHTLDGSICPTCNIVHDFHGITDGGVPPQVIEAILSFLDTMPDGVVKNILAVESKKPLQADLVTGFLGFSSHMDHVEMTGPLLRVVVEFLDEQTDGAISRRWEVYQLERRLITSHMSLKTANDALDDVSHDPEAPEGITSVMQFLCDIMLDRIEALTMEYRQKAEEANYEPQEMIIKAGVYPEGFEPHLERLMLEEVFRTLERERRDED